MASDIGFQRSCAQSESVQKTAHIRRERANLDQVVLIKHRERTTWHDMTLTQKVVDFTARHQFSAIAGCWALGIAGAFGAIMRNPCVEIH
jgi:hypothetical protein